MAWIGTTSPSFIALPGMIVWLAPSLPKACGKYRIPCSIGTVIVLTGSNAIREPAALAIPGVSV